MLSFFDTHAHLDDDRFEADRDAVVRRAEEVGLVRVLAVGTTAAASRRCVELAARYPLLRATVGIQPNHVAQEPVDAWDAIVALASLPSVVALGETGLDRYWDYTPFAQQEDMFARHLALSRRTNLPVVIHSRECDADILRILREDFDKHGPIRAVMHSFTGSGETAQACVAMGLYISFAGMLTYKNAQSLRVIARTVPHDRLLIETDAPYLAPVPRRGTRNEPAFLVHTARVLAEAVGLTLDEVAQRTTENAQRLFGA
jgi:TatD DNase family protein